MAEAFDLNKAIQSGALTVDKGNNKTPTPQKVEIYKQSVTPQQIQTGIQNKSLIEDKPAQQPQQQPGGGNSNSSVGYSPSFAGQTVSVGGVTYKSTDGVNWSPEQAQADIQAQIENIYNPQVEYLNQAEQLLRGDYGNVQKGIETQFGQYQNEAQMAKEKQLGQNAENKIQTQNRQQDALASARRLYDELRRGSQQRFGGATSAGQASYELLGTEQARQQGNINRQSNDMFRQIETSNQDIEKEYQNNLMKLQTNKQQAISQAQADFNQKLNQINMNRAQLASEKSQARLSALQALQQQVFAISQQNKQFEQTLEMQRQQALLQNQNYMAQLNAQAGAVSKANQMFQSQVPNQTSTNLTYGGGVATAQNPNQVQTSVGQMGPAMNYNYRSLDDNRMA